MISGNDDLATIENARKSGAKEFVIKPFNSSRISEVIKNFTTFKAQNMNPRVMIADDDELMRDLLSSTLTKLGAVVVFKAVDGADMMNALATSRVPDILFLDLEMPKLGGLECLQRIKEKGIHVFSAVVSAHGSLENVQAAINQGADTFIVKPYTEEKIAHVLKQFSGGK
jgi:two-component system chemotaxis response regulator CheY